MHFRLYNNYPVTFVNFGDLSNEALEWCRNRGDVVDLILEDTFMAKKGEIDPLKVKDWESMQPNLWLLRFTWYKKPFSLLLSPYKKTLWLDLDCQVRGSLSPLFELSLGEGGLGIVPENSAYQQINLLKKRMLPGQTMYNAGVVLFENQSKIVQGWAEGAVSSNHLFCSDQQLLVDLLFSKKLSFLSLPPEYNWTIDQNFNEKAVIFHWWGDQGKEILKKQSDFLITQMGVDLSFNQREELVGKVTFISF